MQAYIKYLVNISLLDKTTWVLINTTIKISSWSFQQEMDQFQMTLLFASIVFIFQVSWVDKININLKKNV